jgi:hypothetical protein
VPGAIGSAARKVSVAALEKQLGSLTGAVGDNVKAPCPPASAMPPRACSVNEVAVRLILWKALAA